LKGLPGIFAAGSAIIFFALAATSTPAGGAAAGRGIREAPEVSPGGGTAPRPFYLPYQYSSFADDTAFYANAYSAAGQTADDASLKGTNCCTEFTEGGIGSIRAGTISHHLFIRDLIARYFTGLARRVHPGTIILIGPNHHARGHSPIAISAIRWRTPFGFVEPDTARIRKISGTGLACVEEEPFVNEHSIGALVPFIRRTFPGTLILPIIYKKTAERRDCAELGRVLAGMIDSAIVLASLDFSHYRTCSEAEKEDIASLGVLLSLATERIDEAFVDSRPAFLTLLSLSRTIGAARVEVVDHTNSGILSHNRRVGCTSYINTYIETRGGR
jgi:AmmeMemoRadiSam system protein B